MMNHRQSPVVVTNHKQSHAICEACWFDERGEVVPPLLAPTRTIAYCCFCGSPTIAGISIRVEQNAVTRHFCQKNRQLAVAR